MKNLFTYLIVFSSLLIFNNIPNANAQKNQTDESKISFDGLKFRSIGPAFMSGRIADIAIHPENKNIWIVAVGSGGVCFGSAYWQG